MTHVTSLHCFHHSPAAFSPLAGLIAPANAQGTGSAVIDAVEEFSLDTMRGLCVMVMPGPDAWSRQQGTPREDPGPIEVGGAEFMKDLFDNYLATGDQLARPLALGLAQALADLGVRTEPFWGRRSRRSPSHCLIPGSAGSTGTGADCTGRGTVRPGGWWETSSRT